MQNRSLSPSSLCRDWTTEDQMRWCLGILLLQYLLYEDSTYPGVVQRMLCFLSNMHSQRVLCDLHHPNHSYRTRGKAHTPILQMQKPRHRDEVPWSRLRSHIQHRTEPGCQPSSLIIFKVRILPVVHILYTTGKMVHSELHGILQ